MPKKIRDSIFILFIFIFITAGTTICLFASGYKFNLSWPLQFNRILQKTGTLNVSTSPKGAAIYLNQKKQTIPGIKLFKKDYLSTPAKIKNLLPGNYLLTLSKENYWPAEKKVTIEPGLTTIIEDINLFRSDLPTIVYKTEDNSYQLSPTGDYLYLNTSGEFINLRYLTKELDIETATSSGFWLEGGDKFLQSGKIYSLNENDIIDLTTTFGNSILNWEYNKNQEAIYYTLKNGSISRLEKDYKTSSLILKSDNILDYLQEDNSLFVITQVEAKKYLQEYDIAKQQEIKKMELPQIGDYSFLDNNKNAYIFLYDQKNASLYLVNKTDWQKSIILNEVKGWDFISKEKIIYHNGWEIYLFAIEENETSLLNRVGKPIKDIIWHPKDNYFIFSTTYDIQAGDLRNNLLVTLFFANSEINNLTLDSKNNILYFQAQIGKQPGIYKLLLK